MHECISNLKNSFRQQENSMFQNHIESFVCIDDMLAKTLVDKIVCEKSLL